MTATEGAAMDETETTAQGLDVAALAADLPRILDEVAYGQIADEQCLTILPTRYGASVPSHWQDEVRQRSRPFYDVVVPMAEALTDALAEVAAADRILTSIPVNGHADPTQPAERGRLACATCSPYPDSDHAAEGDGRATPETGEPR